MDGVHKYLFGLYSSIDWTPDALKARTHARTRAYTTHARKHKHAHARAHTNTHLYMRIRRHFVSSC